MSRPTHGGTIFDVLRGFSPSRTRTGFGRMVATSLAVLISLLLVGSVGPVYAADGAAGTSSDTTTAATTSGSSTDAGTDPGTTGEPAADPSGTPTDTPPGGATSGATDSPSDSPSSGDGSTPASDTSSSDTSTSGATTASSPMLQAALSTVTPLAVNCSTAVYGGFEVDGNTAVDCSKLDWDTPVGQKVTDGLGDSSTYGGGSAENTDPSTWVTGPTPNAKSDIDKAWAYSYVDPGTGHVFAFFAMTNDSTAGGAGQYDVEYNQVGATQNGNGVMVPRRTPGDLLFRVSSVGGDPLTFTDAKEYTLQSSPSWDSQSCFTISSSSPAAGWCAIPMPPSSFSVGLSDTGTFAEGAVDLTILFQAGGDCSGTFGSTQVRSVTGNSFATSSLKDYVKPLGVTTPSTCSTIVINKQDLAGNPLGGATFKIEPNPSSTSGTGSLTVTDDDSSDLDPADGVVKIGKVQPGTYKVTETVAPTGYLKAAPDNQTLTVGKSATATFTFKDPRQWDQLTATKTVSSATFTRTYDWTIDKGVGDTPAGPFGKTDTKNLPAGSNGDSATFGYQIKVHENGYQDSAWKVTGAITVSNPNDTAVVATVSDQLPGASCTVNGAATAQVTVPANGSASPTYQCTYTGADQPDVTRQGTNSATVTWSKQEYPQSQADVGASGSYTATATKTFSWTENPVHKGVTITDTKYDFGGAGSWDITYGSGSSADHVLTYSLPVAGTPGQCVGSPNTATLTASDDPGYTQKATASATVCLGQDLVVTKDASPTLTRTYNWLVTKDADSGNVTTDANGDASLGFTIHVKAASDPAYDDSDWAMTGAITVTNPNTWEDITLTGLTDSFGGAAADHQTCSITDWGSVSHVIAKNGGSRTYHYSCTFDEKPSYDGTNTATASWDGSATATPSSTADGTVGVTAASWDKAEVDRTADLFDDSGTAGATWTKVNDTPITWSPGLDQEFSYSMPVHVAGGTCEQFTNSARVMNNGVVLAGPAGASITVCNELGLTASKTATATFQRTYHWTLSKTITDPSTVKIDGFSHTFDYTVTATPDGYTDGSYALSGSIHVANPNTDSNIAPIDATVTDVPSGVGGGVSCVVNNGDNTITLKSGESADLPYTCTFTGAPTNGTNVAQITWNDGQGSVVASAPVAFTQTSSVHQSVDVYDDYATGTGHLLGTATWGDNPTSFTYSKEFTAPDTSCTDFTNNAWITPLNGTAHLADGSATATICPTPGTWTVVKSSTPVDGSVVDPGEAITYHVTVTKTGGVDPTNVVVVDDLTDVVDHAGDPSFSAPSGTHASYDAATHQLTWTIDDLASSATLDYTVQVDQDAVGVTLANHVTSTGSTNCPADPRQESPDCTTTHYTPAWTLTKTSDPANHQQVLPGDTVRYTLTVENTGPAALTGATVQDDLAHVLDHATWNDDASTGSGSAALSGNTLTWTLGKVAVGDSVTLTYSVTVDEDADGVTLHNVATPTTPGGSCVEDRCDTWHHTPAWTLTKTSDPANHQQVLPGDTVRYTLTVENTGPAALTGATVQDDLAHVLDHATWNDDASTGSGSAALSGNTLTWTLGKVAVGDSVTLTYSVTVDEDADGVTLHNVATPTTPGGSCVEDRCDTWHHTPEWTLTKTSDPATGTTVRPGDTITYTLTVDNTGPAKMKDAQVTDDLSDVLPYAAGGELQQPLAAGISVKGSTLTWDVPDVAKGGSASVSYSVVVADGAWGVTLENVATPETPGGSCTTRCSTTHPTPHYTLSKTSDPATGSTVMPPYLGAAGTTITYTLTAVNDSDGVVRGATVTDDLSDVLDNAVFDDGSIQASGAGSASRSGDTLTWSLPTLQPDDTATVTYAVTVAQSQWNATLHNVTTPDRQGSCALGQDQQPVGCDTTQTTPSYTQLAVKKVDAETGETLAGAEFSLATAADPGTVIDTATSGTDGIAAFSTKLQPGDFVVTETKAPQGYDLPADATMPVTISDPGNFVANGQMSPIEFGDPALGAMAITKEQFRSTDGGATWTPMQPTDTVGYGDEIKYVLDVTSTGPRLHHDVTLTDYVPGYNPADTTSTVKATLVPGSASCTGDLTCTVTEDAATGLVTWSAGTLTDATGTAQMVVAVPEVPADAVYDANGDYVNTVWNEGQLAWTENVPSSDSPVSHELTSNQVVATATSHLEVSPPLPPTHKPPHHRPPHHQPPHGAPTPPQAPTLPNTGGPAWWYLPTGAGLVLLGAGLMLGHEGRRRRRA